MNILSTYLSRGAIALLLPVAIWSSPAKQTDKTTNKPLIDTIKSGYANPVIPGDYPDPSVIRVGDTYWCAGTSSEWGPFYPLYKSTDLVNWKPSGFAFKKRPEWAISSFWAPELYYHNKTYYLYYTARRTKDKKACIGVATSTDPAKGFTDHGVIIEHGTESIDAFVYNDNGQLYISWKAYGLDKRPIEILGSKLSADGLKLQGEPFTMLRDDNRKGLEGQSIVKKNGWYYMLYSAGGCCGIRCDYNVRVARSKTIDGMYENYEANPILTENDTWRCPGHGTLVETPDNRYYFLYHAYNKKDNVYAGRIGLVDELIFDATTGWPRFKNGNSPSVKAEMPVKGTQQITQLSYTDNFAKPVLNDQWAWDYRNSTPSIKVGGGKLSLSGKKDSANKAGIALSVRAQTSTYEFTTQVANVNNALKGLAIYGDADHAIGIGVTGKNIELWQVKGKERTVFAKAQLLRDTPVRFKMTVKNKADFKFYYAIVDAKWVELKGETDNYDARGLPGWDRPPRPGLIYSGNGTDQAIFSSFNIKYTK